MPNYFLTFQSRLLGPDTAIADKCNPSRNRAGHFHEYPTYQELTFACVLIFGAFMLSLGKLYAALQGFKLECGRKKFRLHK